MPEANLNMLPIRQLTADLFRKTRLKLFKKSCFVIVLAFCPFDGTRKYVVINDTSEIGNTQHNRYDRQPNAPEKKKVIEIKVIIAIKPFADVIHPTVLGLSFTVNISPTKLKVNAPIITLPIPSMGKKICITRKFGANKHPRVPMTTANVPSNSNFLLSNLTHKIPNRTAKMTETMLDRVTN